MMTILLLSISTKRSNLPTCTAFLMCEARMSQIIYYLWNYLIWSSLQELYAKLNRMAGIAAEMFVARERFATLLMMRLTETVILWLSEDQTFWEEIEQGPKPLGPLGLQQVCSFSLSFLSFICQLIFTSFPFCAVLPGHAICHYFWARSISVSACTSSHFGYH
jgi:hypothetical protein